MEDVRPNLQLAKDFGYANGDKPDGMASLRQYAELDKTIKDIEKKVRLNDDVASAFKDLQAKLDNFLNRVSV